MEFSAGIKACCDGHVKVVRQAWQRNVWIASARPCLPSPKSRVKVCIGVSKVGTFLVGTGVALGIDTFGRSPPAFDLTPGTHWCRYSSRRGRRGETAGRAIIWGAGFEQTMERGALGPAF